MLTALFTSIRLHTSMDFHSSIIRYLFWFATRTDQSLPGKRLLPRNAEGMRRMSGEVLDGKERDERFRDNLADPGSPAVTIPNYSNYLREKRSHADVAVIIIGDQLSKHNENHRTRYTSVGNLKSILLQLGNHLQN